MEMNLALKLAFSLKYAYKSVITKNSSLFTHKSHMEKRFAFMWSHVNVHLMNVSVSFTLLLAPVLVSTSS